MMSSVPLSSVKLPRVSVYTLRFYIFPVFCSHATADRLIHGETCKKTAHICGG